MSEAKKVRVSNPKYANQYIKAQFFYARFPTDSDSGFRFLITSSTTNLVAMTVYVYVQFLSGKFKNKRKQGNRRRIIGAGRERRNSNGYS
jgi:hypothetical protein